MVTVRLWDDALGRDRDVPVPAEVLQELAGMVFGDAVWRHLLQGETGPEVVERLRLRHRRWTARMREAMTAPPSPDAVMAQAEALRAAGKSWRETAAATGVSVTTLRRRLEARAA